MLGLFNCNVYGRKDVKTGTATVTQGNSAGATSGSKILVIVADKEIYLSVGSVIAGDEDSRDNIVISTDEGISAAVSGLYRITSDLTYNKVRTFGTKKGRASLILTIFSIVSAVGAAVAASPKDSCSGLSCVKGYTWLLVVASAVTAIISWYKDNVA